MRRTKHTCIPCAHKSSETSSLRLVVSLSKTLVQDVHPKSCLCVARAWHFRDYAHTSHCMSSGQQCTHLWNSHSASCFNLTTLRDRGRLASDARCDKPRWCGVDRQSEHSYFRVDGQWIWGLPGPHCPPSRVCTTLPVVCNASPCGVRGGAFPWRPEVPLRWLSARRSTAH
jgi:hypothetical protein